jgi:hypothetical protein
LHAVGFALMPGLRPVGLSQLALSEMAARMRTCNQGPVVPACSSHLFRCIPAMLSEQLGHPRFVLNGGCMSRILARILNTLVFLVATIYFVVDGVFS